jgi:putative flippase GtrA
MNPRRHSVKALLRDLRSPERGLAGQGLRFVIAGGIVASVYLTVTTVLHEAFDVRFQIALAGGFTVGLCIHFTLQRLFVWRHHERFALPIRHQAARYLCMCAVQYGLTALATTLLPGPLGLPVEGIYVVSALSLACLNFAVFRSRVFHAGVTCDEQLASTVA